MRRLYRTVAKALEEPLGFVTAIAGWFLAAFVILVALRILEWLVKLPRISP